MEYSTHIDTILQVKKLVLYHIDLVETDSELLHTVIKNFDGFVNPAIVIETIEDVKLRNEILERVLKNLTEGETALDKLLIRNMAESYYYIDDPRAVLKLIMQKTGNRMNPRVVSEIINMVKSSEKM